MGMKVLRFGDDLGDFFFFFFCISLHECWDCDVRGTVSSYLRDLGIEENRAGLDEIGSVLGFAELHLPTAATLCQVL